MRKLRRVKCKGGFAYRIVDKVELDISCELTCGINARSDDKVHIGDIILKPCKQGIEVYTAEESADNACYKRILQQARKSVDQLERRDSNVIVGNAAARSGIDRHKHGENYAVYNTAHQGLGIKQLLQERRKLLSDAEEIIHIEIFDIYGLGIGIGRLGVYEQAAGSTLNIHDIYAELGRSVFGELEAQIVIQRIIAQTATYVGYVFKTVLFTAGNTRTLDMSINLVALGDIVKHRE